MNWPALHTFSLHRFALYIFSIHAFSIHTFSFYTWIQTIAQLSVDRIVNALPEGFLIALFAWVLLRVLRRQSAGTRFAVWFGALLAVALLPLLAGVMLAGISEGRTLAAPGMSFSGKSWGNLHPAITIPGSWAFFAFLVWSVGACLGMTRLAGGLWRLRQLRRSCTAIEVADLDPAVQKIVQRTVETLSAAGPVIVATSERVRVPSAIGFWKRTIVLPAWALRELAPHDLNAILLHEYAHLRRGDDWTNLIQKIVRAIFFFHPAVWWIENRLSMEREMACDDAVLAETSNPYEYASCLVSLLEKSLAHRQWSMAQAAVDRAREAALRLKRILDSNRPRATGVWKPALGMVGVFFAVCLALLPHAPQFITFDSGARGVNTDYAQMTALQRTSLQRASLMSSSGQSSLVHSSTQAAVVVPAAFVSPTVVSSLLRDGESSFGRAEKVAAPKLVPAHAVAARANVARSNMARSIQALAYEEVTPVETLAPEAVVAINANANADQQLVPQFETLVFIEATEYMPADSRASIVTSGMASGTTADNIPVWSIQVWRVTLVTAIHERFARVPVASSI